MTYKEAEEYIENAKRKKDIPGTGGLKELCRRLGEPQACLRFISVMGIKNRKAVVAYLSSILKSAGAKAGSYQLSAAAKEQNRIQVKGRPITKKDFCDKLQQVLAIAEQMEAEGRKPLQLWEIETAMAFLYFAQKECELVVWEGSYAHLQEMSGIMPTPLAILCTPICSDRMQYADEAPAQIAEALACFMQRGVPVISAKQPPEAEQVLRQQAEALDCVYAPVETADIKKVKYGLEKQRFTYKEWKDIELSVGGKEEIENAALALEAVRQLKESAILSIWEEKERKLVKSKFLETAVRKGVEQAKWDGSLTVLEKKPWFILKEVSNAAEAKDLMESLAQYVLKKRMIFMMSSLRTMEYEAIIRQIAEGAEHVITLTVREDAEGMHAYELASEFQGYHSSVTAVDSPEEAIELAHLLSDKDSVIVAFGALACIEKLKGIFTDYPLLPVPPHQR